MAAVSASLPNPASFLYTELSLSDPFHCLAEGKRRCDPWGIYRHRQSDTWASGTLLMSKPAAPEFAILVHRID